MGEGKKEVKSSKNVEARFDELRKILAAQKAQKEEYIHNKMEEIREKLKR